MLNGSSLNSVTLNGAHVWASVPEPVPVVPEPSYRWRLRVMVGGENLSSRWVGVATIDREEGGAGISEITFYVPPGPVVPEEWRRRALAITYISNTQGVTTEERRFTGQVVNPVWDPRSRLMRCQCSDQMQQRVEALSEPYVASLTGGVWSADVYEPVQGRSHWDYALERLGTRTASLDCSPMGQLRVTSWYAGTADFLWGSGTTIDESVVLELASAGEVTNRVELDVSYRYARLWQRNESYSWTHPGTAGLTGLSGFCLWRTFPSELPTVQMVEEVASANGQSVLSPLYYELPETMPDPCGDGNPWINNNTAERLLLGAVWTGARRWAQTVTENMRVVLAVPSGQVEATQVIERAGYSLEIEREDEVEAWESQPATGGTSGWNDLVDEERRNMEFLVALLEWFTKLVQAHRQTTVTWAAPTSMAMGVDLVHTLEVNAQGTRARGKCRRIVDRFDPDAGSAITTISIALMRCGGASDPLVPPPRLDHEPAPGGGGGAAPGDDLPTQISSLGSPDYDPEIDGFSGNADAGGGPSVFPRDLVAPAEEIPESQRDEYVLTGEVLYRVGIPNDLLEM